MRKLLIVPVVLAIALVGGIGSDTPTAEALPAGFVSTIFPAAGTSASHGVAVDANGIVWWAAFSSPGAIVRQDPSFVPGPVGVTVYPLPGGALSGPITNQVDPTGNIWFGTSSQHIGKMTPGGAFTDFGLIPEPGCFPDQLAFDAASPPNVWFDCLGTDKLGRLNMPAGTYDMFVTPTANSGPSGITVDFTGIVWSIERNAHNVVRLDPALAVPNTSNGITEFAIPTPPAGPETVKVCGKRVWFSELSVAEIGFLDKDTNSITEFPLEPGATTYGLVIDGDGNPWVTHPSQTKIYGFDVGTNIPTTYATPTTPHHIALSPSGELWYSDGQGQVVRLTPDVPLEPPCKPLEPPTTPPGPSVVGGIAGLLDADDGVVPSASQSGSDKIGYIAALSAIIGATLIAGGWFARRRWLKLRLATVRQRSALGPITPTKGIGPRAFLTPQSRWLANITGGRLIAGGWCARRRWLR